MKPENGEILMSYRIEQLETTMRDLSQIKDTVIRLESKVETLISVTEETRKKTEFLQGKYWLLMGAVLVISCILQWFVFPNVEKHIEIRSSPQSQTQTHIADK